MRHGVLLALFLPISLAACKDKITFYHVAKETPGNAVNEPPSLAPSNDLPEAASRQSLFWSVPKNWNALGASGMRRASFTIKGHAQDEADISVVVFPGSAGGALANINRWRGQIGLPPLQESELARNSRRISGPAGEMALFDFVSADPINGAPQKTRVLGAILEFQNQSWFFKMTGHDSIVTAAKPDFEKFLKSLHTP